MTQEPEKGAHRGLIKASFSGGCCVHAAELPGSESDPERIPGRDLSASVRSGAMVDIENCNNSYGRDKRRLVHSWKAPVSALLGQDT